MKPGDDGYDFFTRGGTLDCGLCCDTGTVHQQPEGKPMEHVPCTDEACVKRRASQ